VIDRLLHVIADELKVAPDTLGAASGTDTVEAWDSLGHLNVILAVEEAFGIRFPSEAIPQLTSVGALLVGIREATAGERT
jgi:acyl carrier protein